VSGVAGLPVFVLLAGLAVGAPAALCAAATLRLVPHAHPRARYLFVVALFALASLGPVWRAAAPSGPARPEAAAPGRARSGSGTGILVVRAERGVADVMSRASALPRAASEAGGGWIVVLWGAGALVLLARELRGHLRLRAARRGWRPAPASVLRLLGRPAPVPILVGAREGPLAMGVLRPCIVLPAWLEEEALPAVLRHELEHVAWRDPLVNAAMRLVCVAFWPWPHLWYLARLARVEREIAADRAGAGESPVAYAEVLVGVARRRMSSPALSSAHHAAGDLEVRLRRLFGARTEWRRLALLAPPSLLLCAATLAAVSPPEARARTSSQAIPFPAPAARLPHDAAPPPASPTPGRGARSGAGAAAVDPARPAETKPAARRWPLRFANLAGTPLEVMEATAADGPDGAPSVSGTEVRLRNPGGRTVTGFALGFVRDGSVTAVLNDSSDVAPGEEYLVRVPGDGTINGTRRSLVVAVLGAQLGRDGAWGIPTPPGVLPPAPRELQLPGRSTP
jgi:hypothetical protein